MKSFLFYRGGFWDNLADKARKLGILVANYRSPHSPPDAAKRLCCRLVAWLVRVPADGP